jgi:hypothetical protein
MITTHYDSTAIFTAAVEYMADKLFTFTECQAGVMCGRKAYTLYIISVLIPQPFTKRGGYIPERKHQGCQNQGKGKVK